MAATTAAAVMDRLAMIGSIVRLCNYLEPFSKNEQIGFCFSFLQLDLPSSASVFFLIKRNGTDQLLIF
jgi:hypothetical protein